ncbi:MAG: putative DNA primase/helicase, partial [Oleiphilaceae bacterium]
MTDINAAIHLLESFNYELAHDDMREPFIIVYPDEKKMLFRLKGSDFKRFFDYKYMVANLSSPASILFKSTVQTLEGKAIFESDMIQPDVRLIGNYEYVEIDLCDSTYEAVRITAEGFEITQPQSNFIRRHGLLPLPRPEVLTQDEVQQAIAEFRSLLNVTDDQFVLVMGAVLMGFHPKGPYPVLFVQGEHGSA